MQSNDLLSLAYSTTKQLSGNCKQLSWCYYLATTKNNLYRVYSAIYVSLLSLFLCCHTNMFRNASKVKGIRFL